MPATRATQPVWIPPAVALAVAALLSACRALGFGEGLLLGATPASGLALAAAVVLRGPGALAAAAGFALAGLAWGLGPSVAAIDALAHGLAAYAAAALMRHLARRYTRPERTRTREWLIFLAGTVAFTATVAAIVALGTAVHALGTWRTLLLAANFEPLGILTCGAMLASAREARAVLSNPRPVLAILFLGVALLTLLGVFLALPGGLVSPSGITLLLAVPFCLWVAMQPRSLDGAAVSFLAAHVALYVILRQTGSVVRADYVTTVLYLNIVIATCQLVHAVNRDRLSALEAIAAHKAELEARVVKRTARLEQMTERAIAADKAKTKFLATVSHEVRTPLNGVIGMASVVLAADLDADTRRNVAMIRSSGLHLLDVINRILDYFRLDQAPTAHDDVDFDLAELAEEVVGEARYSDHAAGIELRTTVDPSLLTRRHGYRQGLRQILTNLVGNAAKFTERGSVTVRLLAREADAVRIEVQDTGIGIPVGRREGIFQPYEQVDGSISRRFGGTGLGLAICAELAERMHGRIGVLSEEGAGSLFWVELPLAVAAEQSPLPAVSLVG